MKVPGKYYPALKHGETFTVPDKFLGNKSMKQFHIDIEGLKLIMYILGIHFSCSGYGRRLPWLRGRGSIPRSGVPGSEGQEALSDGLCRLGSL